VRASAALILRSPWSIEGGPLGGSSSFGTRTCRPRDLSLANITRQFNFRSNRPLLHESQVFEKRAQSLIHMYATDMAEENLKLTARPLSKQG
jgi:hypothetical protein